MLTGSSSFQRQDKWSLKCQKPSYWNDYKIGKRALIIKTIKESFASYSLASSRPRESNQNDGRPLWWYLETTKGPQSLCDEIRVSNESYNEEKRVIDIPKWDESIAQRNLQSHQRFRRSLLSDFNKRYWVECSCHVEILRLNGKILIWGS